MENCPKCKTAWLEDESIYDYFRKTGQTKEEATETAKSYGCTKENPKSFGKDVVGIEVRGKYDGVSYWECQKCKTVFDRFTMKETTITKIRIRKILLLME